MAAPVPNALTRGILAAMLRPTADAGSDHYLRLILIRETPLGGLMSPANQAIVTLTPIIQAWGGNHISYVARSGSFAKGTANKSTSDLDLFISIQSWCEIPLREICISLQDRLHEAKLPATFQNASVGTRISGLNVDLVPARQHSAWGGDHTIYNKRTSTWKKTNVQMHVKIVGMSECLNEIRLLKVWRDQNALDFPSFFLELSVIRALKDDWYGTLSSRLLKVLDYLANDFLGARIVDPANLSNVLSDDVSLVEKTKIQNAARRCLNSQWVGIVR